MATFSSAFKAQVTAAGASLTVAPSQDNRQRSRIVLRDTYTLTGAELATDIINLDKLGIPAGNARLVPEESRIRLAGAGNATLTGKLQGVTPAGVATDLTTAVQFTQAAIHTFAAPSVAPVPEVNSKDELRYLLTVVTAATAGRVLEFELVFDVFGR